MTHQILDPTGKRLLFSDGKRVIGIASDMEDCCCSPSNCLTCISLDPTDVWIKTWSGTSGGFNNSDTDTSWFESGAAKYDCNSTGIYLKPANTGIFNSDVLAIRRCKWDLSLGDRQVFTYTSKLRNTTFFGVGAGREWGSSVIFAGYGTFSLISDISVRIYHRALADGSSDCTITSHLSGFFSTVLVSTSHEIDIEVENKVLSYSFPSPGFISASIRQIVKIDGVEELSRTESVLLNCSEICRSSVSVGLVDIGFGPIPGVRSGNWGTDSFIKSDIAVSN